MARKEAKSTAALNQHRQAKRRGRWLVLGSGVVVVAVCVLVRNYTLTSSAEAQPPGSVQQASAHSGSADDALPRPGRPQHDVMAVVNGQDIRRDALATACVERYGEEVLESLVNKRLIMHHCRNRGIEVTQQDIDAEIDQMAARFKIGREQWLSMLQRERGINEQQYKRDILWPTLALRKLAADRLTVSDEELQKVYESQFGPSVKARLIVVADREQAEKLRRQLVDQPDDFPRIAMLESQDVNSASIGGLIQPIRRHVGDQAIEREIFALTNGQISSIIPVGNQFAILKCEGHLPARTVPLENVRDDLVNRIKEEKLRDVASDVFQDLQGSATIQNVWNDPSLRDRMPGVVATVNGDQILYKELAGESMLRFGEDVIEVEISHLLLQQALAEANLGVTQADMDAEIAHAATLSGVVDDQGQPDYERWIGLATEEQGLSREQYLRDSVWPSAALKKLTGESVQVTEEDLQKAFEANFGPRVRCRAIVLGTMRRAQEVWAKARQNMSLDYFGDLAAEYSVEPTSKALRGEVPPIRHHSGQPQLEEAAFTLSEGELSGIIQLGDKFAILRCEGLTEPVEVDPQEVRDTLYQDIYEKKLRIAMSEKFAAVRSEARIDNYLAGTSQSPDRPGQSEPPRDMRHDSAVRPAGTVR